MSDEKDPLKEEYAKYLQSDVWKAKRQERLEIDGHKCVCCNSTENLQVHHLTYARCWGEENADVDLITLCRSCHEKIHALAENGTKEVFTNIRTKFEQQGRNLMESLLEPMYANYMYEIETELEKVYSEMCGGHSGNLQREHLYRAIREILKVKKKCRVLRHYEFRTLPNRINTT